MSHYKINIHHSASSTKRNCTVIIVKYIVNIKLQYLYTVKTYSIQVHLYRRKESNSLYKPKIQNIIIHIGI